MSSELVRYNGRKIESKYENPIDNVLIQIADWASPTFKRMNFTPNGITTLSAILSAGALYNLYTKDLQSFAVYAGLSYFFDVMDGYYARKYSMTSTTGDKYDHYKDIIVMLIGVYILYSQYDLLSHPTIIVIILGIYFLCLVYLGCVEVLASDNNQSDVLSLTKSVAPDKETCEQRMKYLRWFGSGTTALVIILAVFCLGGSFDWCLNGNVVPGSINLPITTSDCDMSSSSDDIVDITRIQNSPGGLGMEFLNELRNFGSASLGTDTFGPYSSGTLAERLIRE